MRNESENQGIMEKILIRTIWNEHSGTTNYIHANVWVLFYDCVFSCISTYGSVVSKYLSFHW